MGPRIFILCLKQLMSNWKIAIKLSWAWLVVLVISAIFSQTFFGAITKTNVVTDYFISSFIIIFILILIATLATISIAIGWHRYMLLTEQPPKIHLINFQWPLGSYFWKSLKIAFLFILIALPVMYFALSFISSISSSIIGFGGSIKLFILLNALLLMPLNIFFTWLILRIGMVLPATAIGMELGIFEAFAKTSNHRGQIFVIAILLTLFYSLPTLAPLVFFDFPLRTGLNISADFKIQSFILEFIKFIFNFITFFVSFGILTVLYGHLYEDRPI